MEYGEVPLIDLLPAVIGAEVSESSTAEVAYFTGDGVENITVCRLLGSW